MIIVSLYACAVLANGNLYFLCVTCLTFNAERQGYAKLRIVCRNGLFIIQHLPDVSHFLVFVPLRDRPACVSACVLVRVRAYVHFKC